LQASPFDAGHRLAGTAEFHHMFSLPDIAVISVLALLLFGPDRLPSMMRQAGRFMREVQNTSASFVSEMERAADVEEKIPYVAPEPEPAAAAETPPSVLPGDAKV
jgi:sec-independent protein translocase protein TatA